MRKYILTLLLIGYLLAGYSQTGCDPPIDLEAVVDGFDVQLNWIPPSPSDASKGFLDLQFKFPCYYDDGEAGVESDGNYIYSSKWQDNIFAIYSLNGTFIDSFSIINVERLRDMAYCETDGMMYGAEPLSGDSSRIYKMDFTTRTLVDIFYIEYPVRALAYDPDRDVFYSNNWSTDVMVIDRLSGAILEFIPLSGSYGDYYGFAYDNWTDGGPYLWGFSQGGSHSDIVQMELPGLIETGLVVDMSQYDTISGIGYAGGLFTKEGIVDGTVTLGGLIQNSLIFGLELSQLASPAVLSGYNVYRDAIQLNSSVVTDTFFLDSNLASGVYSYQVTAAYEDTAGTFLCESDPAGPVTAEIADPLVLGGNVFAGIYKLDFGIAQAYLVDGDSIKLTYTSEVNEFGYYYFLECVPGNYYLKSKPSEVSAFRNSHIPTYYGDVYHWEDSPSLELQNNQYNIDIQLIQLASSTPGTRRISGRVMRGDKDNISSSDIQLLLLNSLNECILLDYTDEQGYFSFNELSNGTYKLLCEIPGKKMELLTYVIDDQNPYEDGIRLIIENDEIVMGLEEALPPGISFFSEIYPNPCHSRAYIDINLNEDHNIMIWINSISGHTIYKQEYSLLRGKSRLGLETAGLNAGIYFISFTFEDNSQLTKKIIVIE